MSITLPTRIRRSTGYDPKTMFNRGLVAQTGLLPEGTQLFQDVWPLKILDTKSVIKESVNGGEGKVTKMTGVFQVAEDQNANGRVYTKPIISEAVEAIQEDLNARSVWGEYDHPADAKIHLDRISHLITKVWMEGNTVYGEAEIIEDLQYGRQLKTLMSHGQIGISSRGVGDMEVRERGGQELYYVTEGYRFVTWDCVAEPSVTGAILHLMEGKLRPVKRITARPRRIASQESYEAMLVEEFSKQLSDRL